MEKGFTVPELIEEMTYYADLAMDEVGTGPLGARMIFNVTGGEFHSDRLKGQGRVVPGPRVEYKVFRVEN
jgi:hypothetical protein